MGLPKKGTSEYEAWKNSPAYKEHSENLSRGGKGRIAPNKGQSMSDEQKFKLKVIASERPNKWTEEEEAILRENYLTLEGPALLKLLPGRSPNSIYPKARSMGLIKQSVTRMSREEYTQIQDFLSGDLFLPGEDEKACIQCGFIKPHKYFPKVAKSHDGYHTHCKACYVARYGNDNHKRTRPYVEPVEEVFPEGYKRCGTCQEIKPIEDFGLAKKNKDGKASHCRDCLRTTSEQNRVNNFKANYGITPAEYDEMLGAQNSVCAICRKPETATFPDGRVKPLAVDHCHTTDAIRGLLCTRCNTSLGLMYEDPERVKALLKYIEERCQW